MRVHTLLLVVLLKKLERAHYCLIVEPTFAAKALHIEVLVKLVVVDEREVDLLLAVGVRAQLSELALFTVVNALAAKPCLVAVIAVELLNRAFVVPPGVSGCLDRHHPPSILNRTSRNHTSFRNRSLQVAYDLLWSGSQHIS